MSFKSVKSKSMLLFTQSFVFHWSTVKGTECDTITHLSRQEQ